MSAREVLDLIRLVPVMVMVVATLQLVIQVHLQMGKRKS